MDVKITKPISGGKINAVASKSEAHRLLICAALSGTETFVFCPELSADIEATIRCLYSIGTMIRREPDGLRVIPGEVDRNNQYTLDCGESGATLRFMLPVCGALGYSVSFKMAGLLPARPITGLRNEMITHGCTLSEPGSVELSCAGQLTGGDYTLPGNISSQYISGLLLALPLLRENSSIHITGKLESRPYVDITLDALNQFGINVTEENNVFYIQGGQSFKSPGSVRVGGDWSNAAFWLSAGALTQNGITCENLDFNSKQGDKRIIDYLKDFGASVTCENDSVTVRPGTLRGIKINAGDTPDLVPVLAAVASVADGTTTITGAERLKIKESDRLQTVTKVLSGFGADITKTEDGLIITGRKKLPGGETEGFGDHRIVMTAAILSSVCTNNVIIRNADAVRKSYPGFFDDFSSKLGGIWEEL